MQDIIYNDIEYKLAQKTGYKIVGEKQLAIYDTGEKQAYINENLYKGILNTKKPGFALLRKIGKASCNRKIL